MYKLFINIQSIKILLFILAIILFTNCASDQNRPRLKNTSQRVEPEKNKYDSTLLQPLYEKLKSGDTLSNSEIKTFAGSLETRAGFYDLLADFNKKSLFPAEYYSFEKATESVLTNWLLYPTELDTIPSGIEQVKKVSFSEHDTTFIYYVLQFKTTEPHWAAKDGWMIGVVGPYLKDSKPYDWVAGTFSRFAKAKETTPEKEVAWAHQNVFRRSPS